MSDTLNNNLLPLWKRIWLCWGSPKKFSKWLDRRAIDRTYIYLMTHGINLKDGVDELHDLSDKLWDETFENK